MKNALVFADAGETVHDGVQADFGISADSDVRTDNSVHADFDAGV